MAYPYQRRPTVAAWSNTLDLPTGRGKTETLMLFWLSRRRKGGEGVAGGGKLNRRSYNLRVTIFREW